MSGLFDVFQHQSNLYVSECQLFNNETTNLTDE